MQERAESGKRKTEGGAERIQPIGELKIYGPKGESRKRDRRRKTEGECRKDQTNIGKPKAVKPKAWLKSYGPKAEIRKRDRKRKVESF